MTSKDVTRYAVRIISPPDDRDPYAAMMESKLGGYVRLEDYERLRAAAQTFISAVMPVKREMIEDQGFQDEWNALCDALPAETGG